VVHGSIAHGDDLDDLGGLGAQRRAELVDRLNQAGLQGGGILQAGLGIGNAADDILAEDGLRVHRPGLRQGLAAAQVAQVGRQLGGADIQRQAEKGSILRYGGKGRVRERRLGQPSRQFQAFHLQALRRAE